MSSTREEEKELTNNNVLQSSRDTAASVPDRRSLTKGLDILFNEALFWDTLVVIDGSNSSKKLSVKKSAQFQLQINVKMSEKSYGIKAHWAIMSAQSEKLRSLLTTQTHLLTDANDEDYKMKLFVYGFTTETFRKVIRFFYTGKIEIGYDNIEEIFRLADELDVPELRRLCEEHVSSALCVETTVPLFNIALQENAQELFNRCMEFTLKNIKSLFIPKARTKQSGAYLRYDPKTALKNCPFLDIPQPVLIKILKSNFILRENHVVNFIIEWGRFQLATSSIPLTSTNLRKKLAQILPLARLVALSRDYLQNVLYPLNIVDATILREVLIAKYDNEYLTLEMVQEAGGSPLLLLPAAQLMSDVFNGNIGNQTSNAEYIRSMVKLYLYPREKNWLRFTDFDYENQYAEYMKKVLRPGATMICVNSYENVKKGDRGEYLQHNSNYPPCQVRWETYGNTYWLYWRDLQIVD